ncbi:MAG: hypothetical protein OEX09_04325 [Candidatus Bathyarchaeota archaeon]|nr:hypothetical protein [Candidatus Bathyarchaeota archaeon]
MLANKADGVCLLIGVVVDVDDTLISTGRRMQGVWREILGREVPLEAVETYGLEQIFMKFASPEQIARVREFQKRFWDLLLCLEEVGVELLRLHEPVPYAADVLQSWSKHCRLVYLTGRTENTRDITLGELEKFGFPTKNIQLVMFDLEDYSRAKGENPSGPTLIDAKSRLFSLICQEHDVVRVVDDYPDYFPIYRQSGVTDRIGFLRPRKYSRQQYIEKGATRVVESWEELQGDLPEPT